MADLVVTRIEPAREEPGPDARLLQTLGYSGVLARGVELLGQTVDVVIAVDQEEHSRRRRAGCGAVLNYELLDALQNLPVDEPAAVSYKERSRLETGAARSGVVELAASVVVRRLRRPLALEAVIRDSSRWRSGLRELSLFAPLASRTLHLARQPRELDLAVLEARRFDIGLVVGPRERPTLLHPPGRVRARLGAGQWLQMESLYAQIYTS